jgi:Skp family chaperone for outer membrane proteins
LLGGQLGLAVAHRLLAVVAVSCVALGCILGFMLSIGQTSDAAQAVADAQRAQDAATAVQAEVAQERADLDAMRAELEQREQAVRDRETELTAKQTQLTTREQELADLAAAAQAAAAQSQAAQPAQEARPVWFESCKAARRAGVAPIPQGQPGYRAELDKNGDGIACEE